MKGKDTLHETTNWEVVRAFLPDARIEREAEPDCASATLRIALAEPGGKV